MNVAPPLQPDVSNAFWIAFTPDTNPDEAAHCYRQRYGADPDRVVASLGLLLAGPIPGISISR